MTRIFNLLITFFVTAAAAVAAIPASGQTPIPAAGQSAATPIPPDDRLTVAPTGRYLQHADGTPFFWLADTAWELFHRLDSAGADLYLADRAARGFTLIQAVAVAELDGVGTPNAQGHLPFVDRDPTRPVEAYWDHVDRVIDRANALGLWIGLLPTWGRWWHDADAIFTPENAASFGEFIGRRYRDRHVVWILGGDRPVETDTQRSIIEAMAQGITRGDGGRHLQTYHPQGGRGTTDWFADAPWVDFNMRQNGHGTDYENAYSKTLDDYLRQPAKPVIDAEPIYEDHPIAFDAARNGHSIAADVRRALWWDLFSGAFGHTYGHHSVWQMYDHEAGREPVNAPLMSWREALGRPGAGQMVHARTLLTSRPFFTRVPLPEAIVPDPVPTASPGAGRGRIVATGDKGDSDCTFIMVYTPLSRPFTVRTELIAARRIVARWFDPRTGDSSPAQTFDNTPTRRFTPPTPGEATDWVLLLDAAL